MRTDFGELAEHWYRLMQSVQVVDCQAQTQDVTLATAYQSPGRHYHTLEHVGEMLTWFEVSRTRAVEPSLLQLGIWFHDAVYDSSRNDNEIRSAQCVAECLRRWGWKENLIDRVCQLVLTTRHDGTECADPDAAFLRDLDLAILGTQPERYDRYAIDIRREYDWVTDSEFRKGRKALLSRFLDRRQVYTKEPWAGQESTARTNLRRETESLENAENRP